MFTYPDIICPRCGNDDINTIKNRDVHNWGKVSVLQCDYCGEEWGKPAKDNKLYQDGCMNRLRRD